MDPIRNNCSQLWAFIIYIETVSFRNEFPHSLLFWQPFVFNRIHLSLRQISRREETVCAGPLSHSIGLEEDRYKS
jgi:hypothetical protein